MANVTEIDITRVRGQQLAHLNKLWHSGANHHHPDGPLSRHAIAGVLLYADELFFVEKHGEGFTALKVDMDLCRKTVNERHFKAWVNERAKIDREIAARVAEAEALPFAEPPLEEEV